MSALSGINLFVNDFLMKQLIIIPTFNERENIIALLESIAKTVRPLSADILVVDDNSPDGTAAIVRDRQKTHTGLFLLERPNRDGLGQAYLAGFAWGLKNNYDVLLQMDADLSHNPVYLSEFLDKINKYDFVVGSRYVPGGGVENWGYLRKLLSRGGNIYARYILGVKIFDLTGGFNAWRSEVLRRIGLNNIRSSGYSFQIELKYRALKQGFAYLEIPIIFKERIRGRSKMNSAIIAEALWRLPALRFRNLKNIRVMPERR